MLVEDLIKILKEMDPQSEVVVPVYEGFGFGGYPVVCARDIESVESLKDHEVNQTRIYYVPFEYEVS